MRRFRVLPLVLLAALAGLGAGRLQFEILDIWIDPDRERMTFDKVMVVGISDDRDLRHRFEEKFVSHFRGRGHECVTSYSVVPDLSRPGEREKIIRAIEERNVTAAISVRLVSLETKTGAEWAQRWAGGYQSEWTLRQLVEETLPTTDRKSRRVGIEVVLWDARTGRRVWAGRSSALGFKKLKRQGAGDFVQVVIREMEEDRVL